MRRHLERLKAAICNLHVVAYSIVHLSALTSHCSLKEQEDLKIQDLPTAETVETFDDLPEDIFTTPVSLTQGTRK